MTVSDKDLQKVGSSSVDLNQQLPFVTFNKNRKAGGPIVRSFKDFAVAFIRTLQIGSVEHFSCDTILDI